MGMYMYCKIRKKLFVLLLVAVVLQLRLAVGQMTQVDKDCDSDAAIPIDDYRFSVNEPTAQLCPAIAQVSGENNLSVLLTPNLNSGDANGTFFVDLGNVPDEFMPLCLQRPSVGSTDPTSLMFTIPLGFARLGTFTVVYMYMSSSGQLEQVIIKVPFTTPGIFPAMDVVHFSSDLTLFNVYIELPTRMQTRFCYLDDSDNLQSFDGTPFQFSPLFNPISDDECLLPVDDGRLTVAGRLSSESQDGPLTRFTVYFILKDSCDGVTLAQCMNTSDVMCSNGSIIVEFGSAPPTTPTPTPSLPTPSPDVMTTVTPTAGPPTTGGNIGVIVGAVFGVLAVLALLIAVLVVVVYVCNRKKDKWRVQEEHVDGTELQPLHNEQGNHQPLDSSGSTALTNSNRTDRTGSESSTGMDRINVIPVNTSSNTVLIEGAQKDLSDRHGGPVHIVELSGDSPTLPRDVARLLKASKCFYVFCDGSTENFTDQQREVFREILTVSANIEEKEKVVIVFFGVGENKVIQNGVTEIYHVQSMDSISVEDCVEAIWKSRPTPEPNGNQAEPTVTPNGIGPPNGVKPGQPPPVQSTPADVTPSSDTAQPSLSSIPSKMRQDNPLASSSGPHIGLPPREVSEVLTTSPHTVPVVRKAENEQQRRHEEESGGIPAVIEELKGIRKDNAAALEELKKHTKQFGDINKHTAGTESNTANAAAAATESNATAQEQKELLGDIHRGVRTLQDNAVDEQNQNGEQETEEQEEDDPNSDLLHQQ